MKRRFLVVVMGAVLVASLSGLAEARSLRVRLDPNDSPRNTDIRRVVTDLTTTRVYLRVDSWHRLRPWHAFGEYIIRLDTSGDGGFDRVVEIYPAGNRGFICLVEHSYPDGEPGPLIGDFRAARPTWKSVACSIPRSWFPRIRRAVRFYVGAVDDRAPNTGLYRWI